MKTTRVLNDGSVVSVTMPFGGSRKLLKVEKVSKTVGRGLPKAGDAVRVNEGELAGRTFVVDERFQSLVYLWQEIDGQ